MTTHPGATVDERISRSDGCSGTEDATPLTFWVALAEDQYLQLDDVVVCERDGARARRTGPALGRRHPGAGPARRARASTPTCSSSPTGCCRPRRSRPRRSRRPASSPRCTSRRGRVRRCSGRPARARDQALFFDRMERKLPIGLGRDGEPLFANLDFIDGTRGAHVNISGISGVATKTTYATFLLYSLFNSGVLGDDATNTHALIFNVKGEDLLFLDHDNAQLDDDAARPVPHARARSPARSSRSRCSRRRARATATPSPTSRAARKACTASTGRSRSSSRTTCCRSCSPTPRTTASSTRWSCTTSVPR